MDHDFPVRLHKAVGRLTDSGGGKDVGSIVEKMLPNLRSEKFSITITPETLSLGTRISPKPTECSQNGQAREILKAKDPVVTWGTVDKN